MRNKILFIFIGIILIIFAVTILFANFYGTPIEEYMKNREWVIKEAELREKSEHNWEILKTDEIRCSHCDKTYKIGEKFDYEPANNEKNLKLSKELTGYTKIQTITAQDATWIVFGVTEDGKGLLITTDKPVNGKQNIKFKGIEGYNRIVGILNSICRELYSNSQYGFARGMTIEDINKYLNFTNPVGQYSYTETVYEDGKEKEKTIWKTADLGIKLSDISIYSYGNIQENGSYSPKGKIGPKSLGDYFLDAYILHISKSKGDYYKVEILGSDSISKVKKEKIDFIFGKEGNYYSYWLASRGTTLNKDYVTFGIGLVEEFSATNCLKMYDSTGKATEKNSREEKTGIRPVVEIYTIK